MTAAPARAPMRAATWSLTLRERIAAAAPDGHTAGTERDA